MLTTTETLLKGLAAGNESRWARFYRDYAPFLEGIVLKKHPSMSHADANWDNHIGHPTYVVEPGAKLIFTENDAYPSALIRRP